MGQTPSLEDVRARIDEIDAGLLRLVDERAALSAVVAEAKRAAGEHRFGLRPAREAQVIRALLQAERKAASPQLLVSLWRQIMADSLARQGPYHLSVWGGREQSRTVELARMRFGSIPPLKSAARPEDALAAAKTSGGVGVLALLPESGWWGRMLAEPKLSVFAVLPCLAAWGPASALAVAEVQPEPSGADHTFWVTDATGPAWSVVDQLGLEGLTGRVLGDAGGLKLFALAGFIQREDPRLLAAPGQLKGVIGAASAPFDV